MTNQWLAMILKDREILCSNVACEPRLGSEFAVVLKGLLALLDAQPPPSASLSSPSSWRRV